MVKDVEMIGKTRVIVHLKNGDSIRIDSPEEQSEHLQSMMDGIRDFIGFKSVLGAFYLIKVDEIISMTFVSNEQEPNATS